MSFWRAIGTGIKYIWKTINVIREIFLNLIFFVIILMLIGLLSDSSGTSSTPQNGVLVLDIEGIIVDVTTSDQELYNITKKLNNDKPDLTRENSLFELTQKIDQATNDPGIKGIILKLDNFAGADLPALQYLAKYLMAFKDAGKPIYAVGSSFDQKQYYLASIANEIYLINQGSVSLYGFATNNFYFKSLFDNLKINTHVFRVGTYKSAIEPFIRDDMSDAAKQNTTRWLTTMWGNYLHEIADYRGLETDDLVPAPKIMLSRLKSVSGSMSEYALDNGIVDKVLSSYQANTILDASFNYAPQLSIYNYQLFPNRMRSFNNQLTSSKVTKPLIAVVFVDGTISTGKSASNIAGSDTIANQLREIGNNNNVHAVVLRINSPGGGVYASEAIRSEIVSLRQKDIPVVVSMGGMAASGGYWIATQSDYIIANPNTITGSIGIFGVIPTFEKSLAHIGVYTDGVSTSPLADVNVAQDLPDEVNQLIQMNIENGYDNFVSLVAESRMMSYDSVDHIAQGQVWLGQEAKSIGLVDQLGDFDDAVVKAAELAGLSEYTIDWQKQESSLLVELFGGYSALLPKSALELIYQQLPASHQLQQHVAFWDNLTDPQNRYVYCLNCSDIK